MSPSTAPMQLTYFNIPGRAELSRLLFAYGGLNVEETRYTFDQYFAIKPTLDLPYNQLPTFKIDGQVYGQSIAIARYLAKRVGLYPQDVLAALVADGAADAILDLLTPTYAAVYFEKDEAERALKLERLNGTVYPQALASLEKAVRGPYIVGEALSFADIFLLDFFDNVLDAFPGQIQVDTTPYPKLEAIVAGLRKSDKLQAYYAAKNQA